MTIEVTDEIQAVLGHIEQLNINRCAATTYDLGVAECVRQEIIQGLARHYGIAYHATSKNITTFPVKGTRG